VGAPPGPPTPAPGRPRSVRRSRPAHTRRSWFECAPDLCTEKGLNFQRSNFGTKFLIFACAQRKHMLPLLDRFVRLSSWAGRNLIDDLLDNIFDWMFWLPAEVEFWLHHPSERVYVLGLSIP